MPNHQKVYIIGDYNHQKVYVIGDFEIPASFLANYSAEGKVVDKENFRNFILMQS